jgi:hypothetical protein
MLSIEQCKKILNQNGKSYTDEEAKQIRDWLMATAETALEALEKKKTHSPKQLEIFNNPPNEAKSDHLLTCQHRRAK